MLALVGRSIVGSVIAPTIDLFRGRDVGLKDYVPFGHIRDEGYDMDDFAKDIGYTAVGALIVSTPQIALVGSSIMVPGGTVSTGILAATAPTIGVGAVVGAGIGMMVYINSLEPGSKEYDTMSELAYNIRM